ncbi:MAG TPA: tRNA lysidine(34) synthetase TilS, partial [Candidatus Acidoferrales bacterium]|nr:tRNA lysidine(34) synthetase TilS [Candidatus Acidoferrales bacterium]
MKCQSPSPADLSISLARPLLEFSKAELLAFARENRIRFREDASNLSADFLRNRIRHELLPLLRKKYQPGLDKVVLRLMDIAGAEAQFVSEVARIFCGSRGRHAQSKIVNRQSPIINFPGLSLAVQRKVLQQQLVGFGLPADFELIEQLRREPEREVSVGAGFCVSRDGAGKVRCRELPKSGFDLSEVRLRLSSQRGSVRLGKSWLFWRLQPLRQFQLPPRKQAGRASAAREFFDADKVGDEVILRHWRPGDRFQPIGLKSAAKLQDLFVNAKIPAARRRELALAATKAGDIFWVDGLRIGEQFKLTPQTRRILVWKVGKNADNR